MELPNFIKDKIKSSVYQIQNNFNIIIDSTLQAIGEQKGLPGFDLELVITKVKDEAEGTVYFQGKEVETVDVVGVLTELFEQELGHLPKPVRAMVNKMMGGDSIEDIVLKMLESGDLKAKYNEEDEIISYKMVEGKEELLDLAEFIQSI